MAWSFYAEPHAGHRAVPALVVPPRCTLAAGAAPSPETALAILAYARKRLAPYKRVRRLEFADLPKTISGKIRRVELRAQETARHSDDAAPAGERGVTDLGGGLPPAQALITAA
jgi:acyl-coenzyme A synthetase/AMP-(fatty) acid ligase